MTSNDEHSDDQDSDVLSLVDDAEELGVDEGSYLNENVDVLSQHRSRNRLFKKLLDPTTLVEYQKGLEQSHKELVAPMVVQVDDENLVSKHFTALNVAIMVLIGCYK